MLTLRPVLENCGYKTDFYLLDKYDNQGNYPDNCQNKKLSYQENIEKAKRCSVMLEINKPEQQGLTLRALEALILNKKLITTNASIKTMALCLKEMKNSSDNIVQTACSQRYKSIIPDRCLPGRPVYRAKKNYSGNNPTKLRFLRGSDIRSSSLSTHAR